MRAPYAVALVACMWSSVTLAGKADSIKQLLELGRPEVAQQKCARSGAELSSADPALRELCAEAFWSEAVQADSVTAWLRYQQTWAGTAFADDAREQEARVALRELGQDAPEHSYRGWLDQYGGTQVAARADELLVKAAIRGALDDPKAAVDVARQYPDHPDVLQLVARHPSRFLKVELDGTRPQVIVDPPLAAIDGASARWAVQFEGGAVVEWEQAVILHLEAQGLDRPTIERLGDDERPFVPCPVDGADWTLGVTVDIGGSPAFLRHPGPEVCREAWPVFAVFRGDRPIAWSDSPGRVVHFAEQDARELSGGGASVKLIGPSGPPQIGGPATVGQPVGTLFLVTPLSGGVPYYVAQAPRLHAVTLARDTLKTIALPKGWMLAADNGIVEPGGAAEGTALVEAPRLAGTRWTLPAGEIRVISPVVVHALGLHRDTAADKPSESLPPLVRGQGPVGSTPLAVEILDRAALQGLTSELKAMAVGIRLTRAWRALLHGERTQVVFEGDLAGEAVRGVLDPFPSGVGWKVHVWARAAEAPAGNHDVFAFGWQGRTYVVWAVEGYTEALHYDARGLVREVRAE